MSRLHKNALLVAAAFAAVGQPRCQEKLWETTDAANHYGYLAPSFGDLDHDGYEDILTYCDTGYQTPQGGPFTRVLSGRDGSVLFSRYNGNLWALQGIGDFDGDSFPDFAMSNPGGGNVRIVRVWSPHLDTLLLQINGTATTSTTFGGLLVGRVDLDGDGLPDLLVGDTYVNSSVVHAYDHFGNLLYTIPVVQSNARLADILALDDLDHDGCNEYLIAGFEYSTGFARGYVALVSGRTGAIRRLYLDPQLNELIGVPLARAGDLDRDGVPDYACGNMWGYNGSKVFFFSGASGNLIQTYDPPAGAVFAIPLAAGRDADLDGFPDFVTSAPNTPNPPTTVPGRTYIVSSRDLSVLGETRSDAPTAITPQTYALFLADLGVQPGSPYPVYAFNCSRGRPSVPDAFKVEAWRMSPAGVRIVGTGCNSSGPPPTIGVRRIDTPQGERARIVLGSAPLGAFAWCVAAHRDDLAYAGTTVPYALDPLGFTGCTLLVPPALSDHRTVGTAGADYAYAGIDLPLQLVGTGGLPAAAQWLVYDFATGTFASSPRIEFRVQ